MKSVRDVFDLSGRVIAITGGAGLLGVQHGEAVAAMGGIPVLLDLDIDRAEAAAQGIAQRCGGEAAGLACDITQRGDIETVRDLILARWGRIDGLVNNAANNPKVEDAKSQAWSRLENFPLEQWNQDLAVGLTGAFLCAQILGAEMARRGRGVIVNVASDLAVLAPDQRLYRKEGLPDDQQPVKPVTYSVVKTALIGLTRYLATYWADRGVRVNAISPGGVFNHQDDVFLSRIRPLIPLGRMAERNEYQAAMVFLLSDASSYMTGQNLIIDGGRSCW
ncbi:MAG TPA: SDR family oxidoreductase [bacterium]|nr:SDR family oxidoreductase [bacterium]